MTLSLLPPAAVPTAPRDDAALLGQITALETLCATLRTENDRLKSMLVTDELTGLANRAGFETAFATEQDRLKRGQSPGGLVIMIDLDRFKTINDTLGHAAGDQALRTIADALRAHTRAMDTPARLSGDEFAVLLAGVAPGAAIGRAQHLSLTLNRLTFDFNDAPVRLGASLGVRVMNTTDTCAALLAKADALMYAHKRRHTTSATTPPRGLHAVLSGKSSAHDGDDDTATRTIGGLLGVDVLNRLSGENIIS
jgi:diguanylate cyclase (GGDEF)-like protein